MRDFLKDAAIAVVWFVVLLVVTLTALLTGCGGGEHVLRSDPGKHAVSGTVYSCRWDVRSERMHRVGMSYREFDGWISAEGDELAPFRWYVMQDQAEDGWSETAQEAIESLCAALVRAQEKIDAGDDVADERFNDILEVLRG